MKKKSQKEMVLEHLESGKSITAMEALRLYKCFRLADVIFKLKRDGYRIDTEMVRENDTIFARYRMVVE